MGGIPTKIETDPNILEKMKEMEQEQRRVWEERERLSKALEEEREQNVNTALAQMMQAVKDEKVQHMKNIKRLTNEKALLSKNFKETKEKNSSVKVSLDKSIQRYQKLQSDYD